MCFAILCYVLMLCVIDPHMNELRQFNEFFLPTTYKQLQQQEQKQPQENSNSANGISCLEPQNTPTWTSHIIQ